MFYFDAHCDTLSTGQPIARNSGHFDLCRAAARGDGVQVMAAWGKGQLEQLERLRRFNQDHSPPPNGFTLLPAVEGGDTITSIEELEPFLACKPVFFGLTWNNDNRLAGGCKGEGGGLTPLGRKAVRAMERAGVIVDLSHASRQTFWDVLEMASRPVVVSHACCHSLCPHPRNLTDEQMKTLAQSGGVLGVCFYPHFLRADCETHPAAAEDVWQHMEHALSVMGPCGVGMGSDFDGCDCLPEGIGGTEDVPGFIDALPADKGVKCALAGGNFVRLVCNAAFFCRQQTV